VDFIRKIFSTASGLPPRKVNESFLKHFSGAKSAEWSWQDDRFEVVFFEDDVEKTAQFDQQGELLEYTINIDHDAVPAVILASFSDEYEIMNCIAVYSAGPLRYELILRDKDLTRFQVWVNSLGQINKWEKL